MRVSWLFPKAGSRHSQRPPLSVGLQSATRELRVRRKRDFNKGDPLHQMMALTVLVASLFCASMIRSQTTDPRLTTFENFVNGQVPLKEAIVYRKLSKADGTMQNEEWWRFGWQPETWYVQRLEPDANNPANLVPRPRSACYGASYTNLWAVSSKNVHIVAKATSADSLLDKNSASRNLMFAALSLGFPRILNDYTTEHGAVEWDGLQFRSVVDASNKKSALSGTLTLGENGLPASAQYPGIGDFPAGSVTYEYRRKADTIPDVFIATYGGAELRYEFLSLTLGSNDLSNTGGYVPSLFASNNVERHVTLWTNDKAYSLINGQILPAFEVHQAKKRTGSIILLILVITSVIFLVSLYRRLGQTK
jgi:hypothetical protein